MKLPKVTDNLTIMAPAHKLDMRFGPVTPAQILVLASWNPPLFDPVSQSWSATGLANASWWRAWKIRRKGLFAAGVRPLGKAEGKFYIEWTSKDSIPTTPPPKPRKAARASKRTLALPKVSRRALKPWQPEAVARHVRAIKHFNSSVEASSTGVGKTFIALATARELGLRPMIVCPRSIISDWNEAAEIVGVKPVFAINYEQLKIGNVNCVTPVKHGPRTTFTWDYSSKKVMTIFDEAHRLKNQDSQNAALALGALEKDWPMMLLSATLASDPTEMYVSGLAMGLHKGGTDFIAWAQEHGCHHDGFGLTFTGGEQAMKELHEQVFPLHGNRIRSLDIPNFPRLQVIPKAVDLDDPQQLQAIYDRMELELAILQLKKQKDGEREPNMLTELTRARQHAELLKVPAIVGLARDLEAQGHSVPIFVNYRESLAAIARELQTDCVVIGGQTRKRRDEVKAMFQSNKSHFIACQMQAGGESIGLHDLHGRPRAAIISPSFNAREVVQALGRTPRTGSLSNCSAYIIFARGTIEEAACRSVQRKANNIESLNDGDLMQGFSFAPALRKK